PLHVVVQADVDVLVVAEPEVDPGEQIEGGAGAVKRGRAIIEAAISTGAEAVHDGQGEVLTDRHGQLYLLTDLPEAAEQVSVILRECTKARPPRAQRDGHVRLQTCEVKIRVERE